LTAAERRRRGRKVEISRKKASLTIRWDSMAYSRARIVTSWQLEDTTRDNRPHVPLTPEAGA